MIAQSMLGEFDHEMVNLRKVLERVPEDKPGFAPHPKSMPMARLAGHLAELPGWISTVIHHRAQLGVYLRMNDIPVPGMYGPSADEPGM